MLIDIHHHYVPQGFVDLIRSEGEKYNGVVYRDEASGMDAMQLGSTTPPAADPSSRNRYVLEPGLFDLPTHIEEMTAIGLDMAALSVSPGVFNYGADRDIGVDTSERLNDMIHEAAQAHPDRFVGLGTLPMQDIGAAITELERIDREYGFTGIEIGASVGGHNFDEPQFDALFRRASELDMLIFIHPAFNPAPSRLERYYLMNVIGHPVETGICAASLIFGGTLARYPNIKICLAHGGGMTPAVIGRWDHGWKVRPEGKVVIDQPPSTYYKQLYFDNLCHGDTVMAALIESAGTDRVVVGTDYPYDMMERDPVARLEAQSLAAADRRKIESETAARLLRLDPS